MQELPGILHGQADPFAPTQWSVIVAAGESQADPEASRAALANLCETYWPPLYTYLRARGHSTHDAEDLTQGFFAYVIERKIYKSTDREKGKFRGFWFFRRRTPDLSWHRSNAFSAAQSGHGF